jgi:hypothetical protein
VKALLTSTLAVVFCTFSMGAAAQQNWPEAIPIPVGFEAEGIELGKGHEFFVGANSLASLFGEAFFGIAHPVSELAGAIYKGNLRTGEGAILSLPTGKSVSGLSYDPRTDYLYAATGFGSGIGGMTPDDLPIFTFAAQGVTVYDASSGVIIAEIGFGDGKGTINDCLVTRAGVYCTDSFNDILYKLVLEKGGRLPSTPMVEVIPMSGFEMVPLFNANGLVGNFDGKQLVIVNISTGVLYRVDTASGEATAIEIEGVEQLFIDGDGLYLDGRTLYIMQNFSDKIAVVQLSGDLSGGEFIKYIPTRPGSVATTIIGFGNSLYAINTDIFDRVFSDPALVQSDVVRLRK